MLNVSDKEIEFFKADVNQYSEIDNQIKELKKKIKPFQDKIKELTKEKIKKQETVLSFMESNELDMCNTDTGTLELKTTKSTKTLTKGDVYDKIYEYISKNEVVNVNSSNPEDKAKHLHDYIYKENREVTTNKVLKSK